MIFLTFGFLLASCGHSEYHLVDIANPEYRPNVVFRNSEDLSSPKFAHFIEKYRLDTIFHGETDEFKRILLLRHWIREVIPVNDHSRGGHYSGDGYVEGILDAALKGEGFSCGHYMKVQNGLMNAFGYVTRTLGASPGVPGGLDYPHGMNEIWVNALQKWVLSDAQYDQHFEKNGIPLSALEVRAEYLKNKASDISMVKGPDRVVTEKDLEFHTSRESLAQIYTWVSWDLNNNMCTVWPDFKTMLIFFRDDYSSTHTWFQNGHPHWAYNKPEFIHYVDDPRQIYWTPNTIKSLVRLEGESANIRLSSETPNFKTYQMEILPDETWAPVDSIFTVHLNADNYDLRFRSVNTAGVHGPEYRIVIEKVR